MVIRNNRLQRVLRSIGSWLTRNQQMATMIGVAVVLLVVGVFFFSSISTIFLDPIFWVVLVVAIGLWIAIYLLFIRSGSATTTLQSLRTGLGNTTRAAGPFFRRLPLRWIGLGLLVAVLVYVLFHIPIPDHIATSVANFLVSPLLWWIVGGVVVMGVVGYYFYRNPAVRTTATARLGTAAAATGRSLYSFPWMRILLVGGILLMAWAVLWGGMKAWEYFKVPQFYLAHLTVGLFFLGGIVFKAPRPTESWEHVLTMIVALLIMVLGGILLPKEPLYVFLIISAGLPAILALTFCFSRVNSPSIHYALGAGIVFLIFLILYIAFLQIFPNAEVMEAVLLMGPASILIFFVGLPFIPQYLFPGPPLNIKRGAWWVIAAIFIGFVAIVVYNYHKSEPFLIFWEGFSKGFWWLVRYILTPAGMVLALAATWILLPLDQWPRKIFITVGIFFLFLWWIAVQFLGGLANLREYINDHGVLYVGTAVLFATIGSLAARRLNIRWGWGAVIFLVLFVVIFNFNFSLPEVEIKGSKTPETKEQTGGAADDSAQTKSDSLKNKKNVFVRRLY